MLVTLEGLDGSGKTTVAEVVPDRFPDATVTREPTGSWYGEAVARSIEDDEADPLAELFLYTADHAAHLSQIVRPALERNELVVSDRFADSRYAYQGATLEDTLDAPIDYVRQIHEPFTIVPDRTIYLDVDAETAAERSGATNKFERVDRLERVRENYEYLIEDDPERFVRIDGTQSEDRMIEEALEVLEAALG